MSNTPSQKQRRAERAREFLTELARRFPECFSTDRRQMKPLAIGIQRELRAALDAQPELAGTPNWQVKQALARYTRSPAYLEAIIAGAPRIDLQGNAVAEVTEHARRHANAQREAQKARAAERRRGRDHTREAERKQARLEKLVEKFKNR